MVNTIPRRQDPNAGRPMKTLLQINAGMQGAGSQSSKLADRLAGALLARVPRARHIKRDLSREAIPHLDHGTFRTFADPAAAVTPAQRAGLALSDTLIAELKGADFLVLGAPMYNLMIPSTLKSWIDYVSRAGHTFQFAETGPVGLLNDKKAYVAIAQGGQFLGTSADLESAYLKTALGFLGISDVAFVYAEGLAKGRRAAQASLAKAHERIANLCRSSL